MPVRARRFIECQVERIDAGTVDLGRATGQPAFVVASVSAGREEPDAGGGGAAQSSTAIPRRSRSLIIRSSDGFEVPATQAYTAC